MLQATSWEKNKQTNKSFCYWQPLYSDTQTHDILPWRQAGIDQSAPHLQNAPHAPVHHHDFKSHSWSNLHGSSAELTPGIGEAVSADEVMEHPHLKTPRTCEPSDVFVLWAEKLLKWKVKNDDDLSVSKRVLCFFKNNKCHYCFISWYLKQVTSKAMAWLWPPDSAMQLHWPKTNLRYACQTKFTSINTATEQQNAKAIKTTVNLPFLMRLTPTPLLEVQLPQTSAQSPSAKSAKLGFKTQVFFLFFFPGL